MKATVQWQNNMVFIGSSASGFQIRMDADASFGGLESGVRPMEMIALGLAGCTAMDVISILRKKRQAVTQFEVRIDAPRSADHPKVFTRAIITYIVAGRSVSEDAVLRSIELAATKYCPAQIMFEPAVPMDLQYEIYEDEEDGSKRLAYQGSWQDPLLG